MSLAERFVDVVDFCSRINHNSSREIMRKSSDNQESVVVSLEGV